MLGALEFDALHHLQRRLVYEVAGGASPSLILCELTPLITIGREGSRFHIDLEDQQPDGRPWSIRWVNRGGGCWLHLRGQLVICPILPLRRLGLSVKDYLDRLGQTFAQLLHESGLPELAVQPTRTIHAASRPIACVGAAVRGWVTYHGAVLNVDPGLELYRRVRCGEREPPMTSLLRESRRPVRVAHVRERFVAHFQKVFGLERMVLFMEHPSLSREKRSHALVATR